MGEAQVVDDADGISEILRTQLGDVQPELDVVDPAEHGARLRAIRGLRISIGEVRAKFKYGANVDDDHRAAVHDRLLERDGPGDVAAARHLARRLGSPG